MKIIKYDDGDYKNAVQALVNRSNLDLLDQDDTVWRIIGEVKQEGDAALLRWTRELDLNEFSAGDLRVSAAEIEEAYGRVSASEIEALKVAAENIRAFHRRQEQKSWQYEEGGVVLGQVIRPLQIVGIYVPGGKASYCSPR